MCVCECVCVCVCVCSCGVRNCSICVSSTLSRICAACQPLIISITSPHQITHVFSHVHHTYSVYCVTVRDEVDGAPGLDACTHRWVPTSDLQQCALSTAMRKVCYVKLH